LLIGGALSYIGYTKDMPWSPEAYWAFLFVMLGVPILGHIASIIAYIWYPINREFYRKMYDDLQENAGGSNEAGIPSVGRISLNETV